MTHQCQRLAGQVQGLSLTLLVSTGTLQPLGHVLCQPEDPSNFLLRRCQFRISLQSRKVRTTKIKWRNAPGLNALGSVRAVSHTKDVCRQDLSTRRLEDPAQKESLLVRFKGRRHPDFGGSVQGRRCRDPPTPRCRWLAPAALRTWLPTPASASTWTSPARPTTGSGPGLSGSAPTASASVAPLCPRTSRGCLWQQLTLGSSAALRMAGSASASGSCGDARRWPGFEPTASLSAVGSPTLNSAASPVDKCAYSYLIIFRHVR